MRAGTIAYVHDALRAGTPAGADFYDAATKVDLDGQLQQRRAWVKLYMPNEQGELDIVESFLITVDCGAVDLETARSVAESVRAALESNRRNPALFHRIRIVALDEGNFHRVQLSYRLRRPTL